MDTAATLAFLESFYTGAALYVVPDVAPAVPVAPTSAPSATPVPATPPPAPTPPAAAPVSLPRNTATTPTVASTVAAGQAPLPVSPVPPHAPAAPVMPTTAAPASAVGLPAGQLLGTLPLAQLPAASPAPAGRVQPTPTESPVAHIPFSTLGSNPHGLVVLVRMPAEQFRKLPRNVFLNNLLKALRLVMEDVVLVNVEHEKYPVALCSLRREIAARQILAFGKNLLDVAVYTTQPYEPVLLYGDTAFLGAGEVDMLEYDAGRKKQLWQAVQRMFLS